MAFELKGKIQTVITSFSAGDLFDNTVKLFSTLGYRTERQSRLSESSYAGFIEDFPVARNRMNEKKTLYKEWKSIDLIFQLTREELSTQSQLFDTMKVDNTIIEAYLFFAIELSGNEYSKTQLSDITRELNKVFSMPVMVVFKYGSMLTLSVIDRRLHKTDQSKDVLEKVTLVKDIDIECPHRAHIEILFDLSIDELQRKQHFTNFVGLHNAWHETLNIKELNKRFYLDLFNWYLWAVSSVRFPNNVDDDKDDLVFNSESVIRLLTRLIFVWFIKEKKLVPDSLFDINTLKNRLKDFHPHSGETSFYYRAILQNLFFATLNTPMDNDVTSENEAEKRQFIAKTQKTFSDQYLDQTKYRYADYFTQPDQALQLFATIPFLNGGLFECLDFKDGNKEIRFDGFSSKEKNQAFVPDKLFFASEFVNDFNEAYGTKGKKYKVEGLINLLNRYKFTIAENTPLEEEVALDPEMLGKVFENLLASYNPETQTTARKQTGSFYTPREIVNYMVDESLVAYLKQKLGETGETEERLRILFSQIEDPHQFTKSETNLLIKAISEAKILDPACGSGAYPMGILHRLVDLLKKLDPNNVKWNQLQIERATAETSEVFKSGNISEREIRFNEINKAFDLSMNYPDYARKLFLIENCIYGVDIQQIAIQISKLRFFISLIVDQKVDDSKPNRNILSMPNLETKFVAANTLIGLDKPQQMTLMAGEVEPLEKELASIRHKIFFTRKYSAKKELKKQEKAKRGELKQALMYSGFGEATATQMAGWNPFDPMQSAGFFDPETMFGLTKNEPVKGNIQSNEITVFNKQIEAINKQIEAINVAFQLEHEHEIIKLQLVTAHLQANIIEIELDRIQENINNLYGSIHSKVANIATEPVNILYTVNALNKFIVAINKKINEISLDIKPVISQSNIGVFDIVIGNPPYVRRTELNSEMKKSYERKYYSAYKQYDLYILFIERALELLKDQSTLCFINPIKFFSSDYGLNIRKKIVNENSLVGVLNVSQINVFENAMTYPCIINIKKGLGLETKIVYYNIKKIEEISFLEKLYPIVKYQDDIKKEADYKILFNENRMIDSIIEKIGKMNCTIKDFFSSHRGLANNKINFVSAKHSAIKPTFVKRYFISNETMYVDYCDTNVETTFSGVFSKDLIVLPRTVLSLQSAIKIKGEIILDRIYYLTPIKKVDLNIVIGFINSALINFWFSCFYSSSKVQGGYFDLRGTQIETIPFIPIFDNHEKFSETVGQIISFKESNNQFDTKYLERLLDEMVYKLYELTYEEVKIVDPEFWLTEEEYGIL